MAKYSEALEKPIYQMVRQVVDQIPAGQVATYGQIASIVGGCTARMVGYAMAGLPAGTTVPWHRVVNASGQISPRSNWDSTEHQRLRLIDEGVVFRSNGSIDLATFQWSGPGWEWLVDNDYDPENLEK